MLDALEKHFFVGQVCFDLATALLENLGDNLRAQLICRVCKDICDFEDDAVEELRVLEHVRAVGSIRLAWSIHSTEGCNTATL